MSPESPQYEKAGRPRAITNIPAGAFNFAMLQARNPHVNPLTLRKFLKRDAARGERSQVVKLPLAENEAFIDDDANFIISVGALRVRIIPKGANLFDVESFVGEKRMPKQTQLTYGETVKGVFDLVASVEKSTQIPANNVPDEDESDTGDVYEVLHELAGELGKPTDIIRNPSLYDLRAGLVTESKRPNTKRDLLSGLDQHLEKFHNLNKSSVEQLKSDAAPKAKWFRGHPVAIAGEMHGKKLAYVKNLGAVLVDQKDIPPTDSLQLSWDDSPTPNEKTVASHPVQHPSSVIIPKITRFRTVTS